MEGVHMSSTTSGRSARESLIPPTIRLLILLLICCSLECFVFNYSYFRTSGLKGASYPVTLSGVEKAGDNAYRITDSDNAALVFENIGTHVTNIHMPVTQVVRTVSIDSTGFPVPRNAQGSRGDLTLHANIEVDDSVHPNSMTLPTLLINGQVPSSQWISLHLAGTTNTLRVNLQESNGTYIQFNSDISFNSHRPFMVSPLRLLAYLFVLAVALFSKKISSLYHSIQASPTACRITWAAVAVGTGLLSVGVVLVAKPWAYMNMTTWQADFEYQSMARSLASGHTWIDYPVSEELLKLDNPYSLQERQNNSVPYLFDYALYDGKYYSYFGILPCVLFFLPYYLVTGGDLSPWKVVALGSFLVGVLSVLNGRELFKKWGPQSPLSLQLGVSAAVVCVVQPTMCLSFMSNTYSVPIICAVAFALAASLCWIRASQKEVSRGCRIGLLITGGVLSGLILGCRPPLCLVAILVPLLFGYVSDQRRYSLKEAGKASLIAGIPAAVSGFPFLWWNKIRFGSFLDFGQNYQLTNTDQNNLVGKLAKLPYAIGQGLFSSVLPTTHFPFVTVVTGESESGGEFQGFYFTEPTLGGLFFWFPLGIVIFTLCVPKIRKKMSLETKVFAITVGLFSLLPLIVDVTSAAYATRYLCDMGYLVAFSTIACLLSIRQSLQCQHCQKLFDGVVKFVAVLSLFLGIVAVFMNGRYNCLADMNPPLFLATKQALSAFL